MTPVTGILLAAGDGRRFGGQKLLHRLPGGERVGVAAARNLLAAVPDAVAVVRPEDAELAEALSAVGIRIIENPNAAAACSACGRSGAENDIGSGRVARCG